MGIEAPRAEERVQTVSTRALADGVGFGSTGGGGLGPSQTRTESRSSFAVCLSVRGVAMLQL